MPTGVGGFLRCPCKFANRSGHPPTTFKHILTVRKLEMLLQHLYFQSFDFLLDQGHISQVSWRNWRMFVCTAPWIRLRSRGWFALTWKHRTRVCKNVCIVGNMWMCKMLIWCLYTSTKASERKVACGQKCRYCTLENSGLTHLCAVYSVRNL